MDDRKLAELREDFRDHAKNNRDLRLHVYWGEGEPPYHPGMDAAREVNHRGKLYLRYSGDGATEFAALAERASRLLKPKLLKFVADWKAWPPFGELAWIEAIATPSEELAAVSADNLVDCVLAAGGGRHCSFKLSPAAASVDFIDALQEVPATNDGRKGMPLGEAEIHATRILAEHNRANSTKKMTLSVLSEKIDCSEGTAQKTAAWRAYHKEWEQRHPPKPKAVAMTESIVAVKGEADATLEALIAEQTAELKEDDKLISNARHHRRRTKI